MNLKELKQLSKSKDAEKEIEKFHSAIREYKNLKHGNGRILALILGKNNNYISNLLKAKTRDILILIPIIEKIIELQRIEK
jgi:hypothetical protein